MGKDDGLNGVGKDGEVDKGRIEEDGRGWKWIEEDGRGWKRIEERPNDSSKERQCNNANESKRDDHANSDGILVNLKVALQTMSIR